MASLNSSDTCLIICLGTSEPRVEVDGAWVLLKETAARGKWSEIGTDSGLYRAAEEMRGLVSRGAVLPAGIWFPIVEVAVGKVGATVDLYPVVTDDIEYHKGKLQKDDPRNNDTRPSGELLRDTFFSANVILTESLGKDPTDPRNAFRYVKRFLDRIPLDRYREVHFCQSPGLPVVNSEITLQLLQRCRFKVRLFQVLHPPDHALRHRCITDPANLIAAVPETRLWVDYLLDVVPRLCSEYHYQTALELTAVLESGGHAGRLTGLLSEGAAYWKLDTGPSGGSPFEEQFRKACFGWWIAKALSGRNRPAESVEWCGDTLALTKDLICLYRAGLEGAAHEFEIVICGKAGAIEWKGEPIHPGSGTPRKVTIKALIGRFDPTATKGPDPTLPIPERLQGRDAHFVQMNWDVGESVREVRNHLTHRFGGDEYVIKALPDWKAAVSMTLSLIECGLAALARASLLSFPRLCDFEQLNANIHAELVRLQGEGMI